MTIGSILKNINGEFEIGRVWLSIGTGSMVVAPVIFQAIDTYKNGHWDPAAFCGGYGLGLGGLITSGVLAIGKKDKDVAAARLTAASPPLDDATGGKG